VLRTTRCVSFFSEILANSFPVTVMDDGKKIVSARFALIDFDARIAGFNGFHFVMTIDDSFLHHSA